jgi:hypothetical protein
MSTTITIDENGFKKKHNKVALDRHIIFELTGNLTSADVKFPNGMPFNSRTHNPISVKSGDGWRGLAVNSGPFTMELSNLVPAPEVSPKNDRMTGTIQVGGGTE